MNTKQDDEDPLGNLDQRVVSKTQIPIQLIGTFERAAQKEKMKRQKKRQQHAGQAMTQGCHVALMTA